MFRLAILICLILSLIGCDEALEEASTELSFFEPPFVHPALIEYLAGDLSDRHPNIMALNLEEAQESNQISRALDFEVIPSEIPASLHGLKSAKPIQTNESSSSVWVTQSDVFSCSSCFFHSDFPFLAGKSYDPGWT